ncbi:MAG: type I restriction-modification system subunit M [Acidobacteria bacterium]|nr:type I restriction-modification system subunit M [Acidobacteriota bacterium]
MSRQESKEAETNRAIWRVRGIFRDRLNPTDCRNYILVLLFFRYLSDYRNEKLEEYRLEYRGDEERLRRRMRRERIILPEGCDFESIDSRRNEANLGELINRALEKIEEANRINFDGVFRKIDFNSDAILGETKERNARLKELLEIFADQRLNLMPARNGETLVGNIYQYLIDRFAAEAGRKGGDTFTPDTVAALMAGLLRPVKGDRVCDPACGFGSLLIRLAEEAGECVLFGQEPDPQAWAICRMNLFLHGRENARIEWGDSLSDPKLVEDGVLMKFDIVVTRAPFSLDRWGSTLPEKDRYGRFHRGLPPVNRADYSFITHLIETTREGTGRAGIVVPLGALFRGGAEGRIRKQLIEENLIEAVIGLPANLFYGTSIPTAILIFNRGKQTSDVLLIDSSQELNATQIDRIVGAYQKFESVENFAYRADVRELRENDFNLNLPKYLGRTGMVIKPDLKELQEEIELLELELSEIRLKIGKYLENRS